MSDPSNRRGRFTWQAEPVAIPIPPKEIEAQNVRVMRRKSRICALVLVILIALVVIAGVAISVNLSKFSSVAGLATDVAMLGSDPCPDGSCVKAKLPKLQRRSARRSRYSRRKRVQRVTSSKPNVLTSFGNSQSYYDDSFPSSSKNGLSDWSIAVGDKPRRSKAEASFSGKERASTSSGSARLVGNSDSEKSADTAKLGGSDNERDSNLGFDNLVRLNRRSFLDVGYALIGGSDDSKDVTVSNSNNGELNLSHRKLQSFGRSASPAFQATSYKRRERAHLN